MKKPLITLPPISKRAVLIILAIWCILFLVAVGFDSFFLAWVSWGLIFGTLEWYALARKAKEDTLSEQIWLGTLSKSLAWSIFWRISVGLFLAWLTAHFLFRFVV